MSTYKKVIIGICTFLPLLYIFFMAFAPALGMKGEIYNFLLYSVSKIYFPYLIVIAVAYIVHVYKNKHIAKDKKPLWAFALFIAVPLTVIIYFFMYILKEKKELDVPSSS